MATPTVERLVNADGYSWETPAEAPGQPPVYHSARRGEVIKVTETEAARGESLLVTNFYESPTGIGRVARKEPALVDPNLPAQRERSVADYEATIAQLRAELAEKQRNAPAITPAAPRTLPDVVALTPSTSGVIVPPDADVGVVGVRGVEAASSVALEDLKADELVAHLRAHPEDADRVAELEEASPRPRTTVLEAVERARAGE
jgi:hypothetical protein